MNWNAIYNMVNLAAVVTATLAAGDWAHMGIDPNTALKISGGLIAANNVANMGKQILGSGLFSLFAAQPAPGTIGLTPNAVAVVNAKTPANINVTSVPGSTVHSADLNATS